MKVAETSNKPLTSEQALRPISSGFRDRARFSWKWSENQFYKNNQICLTKVKIC